jgi:hypothetical protein
MTNSLPQKTHAETLIKVTEEYTLRPKKGDRAQVCIATLQYLLDNFAYDFDYDEHGWGNSIKCVEVEDINHLIYQLQKLK